MSGMEAFQKTFAEWFNASDERGWPMFPGQAEKEIRSLKHRRMLWDTE